MPVTRAMTRQKDDTINSNPVFCPLPEPKSSKVSRTRTKATTTSSNASVPKSTSKKTATKSKAKTKKGSSSTTKTAGGRRRGKIPKEASDEEDEKEEEQEEQPKPDHSNESQDKIERDKQIFDTLSQLDVESTQSTAVDDPDEMLDSFQRAPKHGVRFAPSPETSIILEDRELEEEEELKEENRIAEERKAEIQNQLQKFGAKFIPDGLVLSKAKEISTSGMNVLKSAETALRSRYEETMKQLNPQSPTEQGAPTVPKTPLMKTLTSRVGVKRPHSPDGTEHGNLFDESPIPKPDNNQISAVPSTSTPLPAIPQSFDFQNMQPKQAQKKLILESQSKPYKKVIEKELTCSPAKKPRNFNFDMTDDLDEDDTEMDTEPKHDVLSPFVEHEKLHNEDPVKPEQKQKGIELPKSPEVRVIAFENLQSAVAKVQPQSVVASVQEEGNTTGEDSIIFCEEVIKVPKPVPNKKVQAGALEKHSHPHKGPLVKPKAEPPEKLKPAKPKPRMPPTQAQPSQIMEKQHPCTKSDKPNTLTSTVEVVSMSTHHATEEASKQASPPKQHQKIVDATFLVESPNSPDSFHDANATFTTTANGTGPKTTGTEVNRPGISTQPNIMNETVVLNKSTIRTPDSKDSYNITLYEDFDEENKHRENKRIPDWASNKNNMHHELFVMSPQLYHKFAIQTLIKRDPIFPSHRPNFKLFPDVAPKIKK